MTTPFLTTKFFIPYSRHPLVERPRLYAQLNLGVQVSLTLVCAPAGYGKSTLLSEWISQSFTDNLQPNRPFISWLALDAGDNDLARFLGYLFTAFERVEPGLRSKIGPILETIPALPLQSVLTVLINGLQALGSSIILVLDDYQYIANKTIHEAMAFFLDHMPSNVHLVIATRSDPPTPLGRLRARRKLVEIRADDLRFSNDETDDLFNQVLGLGLTAKDLASLEERTEIWIAGLQMAALALKSIPLAKPSDTSLFVKNFSGSNRYILDYLVEEVLSHQSKDIQDFLFQTSILDNLCGSLCDAVTGIRSWTAQGEAGSSQQILEYLDRANLFLIPLDSDRIWYRYHHLFADLLRARLELHDHQKVPELHRCASDWYEQNQRQPEAIEHALEARDFPRACRLIEEVLEQRLLAQNAISMLMGWIQRLPLEIGLTRPWLRIAQAWSAMFTNDVEKIEPLVEAAEQNIHPEDPLELQKSWKGHIACLRAYIADVHSDVPRTIEMYHQALDCLRPDDAAPRTFAEYMLGRAYFIRGEFPQAITVLTENSRECIKARLTNIIAPTLSTLAKVYRIKGRLHDSIEQLKEGQAFIEACDPRRVTVSGLAYFNQANVLREWNDLDAAEKLIRISTELCEPWENPSAICGGYIVLARVLQNNGKLLEAGETLHLAEESIRGRGPFVEVVCELNAARVGFWLASRQIAEASRWAQEWEKNSHPEEPFSIPKEQDEITLARVRIAEGNYEIALQTLAYLSRNAEAGGRIGHLIEIRLLQALALQALGDQNQAHGMLQKSLALAEPEGYIRIFIDEGESMRALLLDYGRTSSSGYIAYAHKLLAIFATSDRVVISKPQLPPLVEPLTAREMDVLRSMADGLSNRQIAAKLILADGTVKFYVHAVLEKLGVQNRTQAVIEAKNQNII